MKRLLIAASIALAYFVMPASANAVEPVECLECGPPPTYQPGCNAMQEAHRGGDVSRWSANLAGDYTNYEFDYSFTGAGTWTVGFHFDVYDRGGVKVGSWDFPGARVFVPPGYTFSATANGSIPVAPFGGTVQMTISGLSDFGSVINGWGQSDNLGCNIMF